MEDSGKYEKATCPVPSLHNHESKDSTQVVYIYSASSEIKHEPADQQAFDECHSQDEPYTTNAYRNAPRPSSEESKVNWSQRREESEIARPSGREIDTENGRSTFSRSDKFVNYQKFWGRDGRANPGDTSGIFRRERSPNEAKTSTCDRRKQNLKGTYHGDENIGRQHAFVMHEKKEDDRASLVDGYYSSEHMGERRRREQYDEHEISEWYKAESKHKNYEDNGRAGRKSFTPIRIYPDSKEVYRDRAQPYKKLEYRHGSDAPPNVTLLGQSGHTPYEMRAKDERYYEEEAVPNDNFEAKLWNHKRVKREGATDGYGGMPLASQRRDNDGLRSTTQENSHHEDNYEAERAGKDEVYRWEKDTSKGKHRIRGGYELERRVSPDSYSRFAHRERLPRFACETSGNKEPHHRYLECYGGHEYDYPRKCERYNEMIHETETQRNQEKNLERRGMGANSPEFEEKQFASQKGYIMPAYQRCCCPCCPCYSIFRQTQRDRSPVSPRCQPPKAPLSPVSTSRPPSHPPNEPAKARSSTMTQQMPPELQLKMVARGLPHLRRRRNRTVYTHDQIEELEEVFKIKHYLDVDEKSSIAKRLGIRTENVEIWFKNRRAKWRKEMKSVKSNSDGEASQYLDEDESNNGEESETYERKSLTSIFSKDIPEERPTMTLYHTGQDGCDNEVDSTAVLAAAT